MSARSNDPPRKVTAVGTIGPVGQSFTVFEKNWTCSQCKGENLARRERCHRCKAPKPEQGGGYVVDDAFQAVLDGGQVSSWSEAIDPNSLLVYYYNRETGETTWERPKSLGTAPHATGWFGRGSTSTNPHAHDMRYYNERNARWLKRPALKQKESIEDNKRSVLEGAYEYNIWYNKYIGDHWKNEQGNEPAESRCDAEREAGFTKADSVDTKTKYFCIHFARGACAKGVECSWFHRTPVVTDEACNDQAKDIFGRERHKDHRDDMGGVGCILSPSRTLYVGGIKRHSYKTPDDLDKCLWHQFGEWGEVESINFIARLSVAFVRYRMRSNCEFAKEAMSNQSLLAGEILNIRWAHDDPNPVAKEAVARSDLDAAVAILKSRGVIQTPSSDDPEGKRSCEIDGPLDYRMPETKRYKIGNYEMPSEMRYPDTDSQYSSVSAIFRQYKPPWRQYQDTASGALYYFNEVTNKTQWELPQEWNSDSTAESTPIAKEKGLTVDEHVTLDGASTESTQPC